MGKVIRVTPEELGAASANLREISESYTEIYTKLLQDANTMGSAWEGEDNLAFVDQINGFCDDLKKMVAKLESVSEALEMQRANYVNRQQDNISQVRKLAN